MKNNKPVISIKDMKVELGGKKILDGINLEVNAGEIIGIVGKSGSGKTTFLRAMLMLQKSDAGTIQMFDQDLSTISDKKLIKIRQRLGMLFQQNALFSSLTLLENVEFPLKEKTRLGAKLIQELALHKVLSVGLDIESVNKYPAELSGGMQKRAALARAIVLDPELLFLDEPTSALDPDSAAELDELILDLQAAMNLTVVIVTHDLDTLWRVTDRVAYISKGKIVCVDTIENMIKHPDKEIQEFFNGPRGRAMQVNKE